MKHYRVAVEGQPAEPSPEWRLEWTDRRAGIGRLVSGTRAINVVVEGGGQDWVVTLHGRRLRATLRTWRERLLAEAEGAGRSHTGPVTVSATLPGLVVAVRVSPGEMVADGDPLLTIEAMKMQNEVRAPRSARVVDVAVAAGDVVTAGARLLTLE